MTRSCPACGSPLEPRPGEKPSRFAERKTCGPRCGGRLSAQTWLLRMVDGASARGAIPYDGSGPKRQIFGAWRRGSKPAPPEPTHAFTAAEQAAIEEALKAGKITRGWSAERYAGNCTTYCKGHGRGLELAFALFLLASPAAAHDPYAEWKDRAGISCCHQKDCHPARYCIRAGGDEGVEMPDGVCAPIPHRQQVPYVTPDGGPHICTEETAVGWRVRCWAPGAGA
jgi:hypothetical protein